ncbi:MAG: hypothetical protein JNK07_01495 [Alphaproteobacteria bacterium]|nr:hypothetical protein [Alphaproteobacteria bacterium]
MSSRILMLAGAALVLAAPAVAKEKEKQVEKRIERSQTCVCTMGGPGEMPAVPGIPAVPPIPPVPPVPPMPPQGQMQTPPNVMMFRDGGDERVVIIQRHGNHFRDSADEDGDGKVTRREFMRRAEEHFKERDRNDDGKLDGDETSPLFFHAPMPPVPNDD